MSGIKFGAILISIFAFYVAPALPLTVLTSMPDLFGPPMAVGERISLFSFGSLASIFLSLVVMWLWALAPFGSGYLAAKLAERQPLFHGLLTGAVGAVLVTLWVRGSWIFELGFALYVVCCGLFGAWLWRCRDQRRIKRSL